MPTPLDLFSSTVLADPPSFDDDGPADAPTDPQCEVCGRDIPWAGRGRRPKRCQDHKTRTKESAGDNTPRGPRATVVDRALKARLDTITGDLQQGFGELAGTISPVAPVTAGTLLHQGPQGIDALVRIASEHPRMLDGLEMAAKTVPFLAVGKFVAAIALAAMVDMGRVQPVGLAAEYLGVAKVAYEVGWQPSTVPSHPSPSSGPPSPDRTTPEPPRFKL